MRSLLLVVSVLALSGCWAGEETPVSDLGDVTPSATPALDAIQLIDFGFEVPDPLEAGAEVPVVNAGDIPHTFTIREADVDTGIVQAGGETTVTLPTEPGTYDVLCTLHVTQMRTTIEVG